MPAQSVAHLAEGAGKVAGSLKFTRFNHGGIDKGLAFTILNLG
jgi:hypothetical protein